MGRGCAGHRSVAGQQDGAGSLPDGLEHALGRARRAPALLETRCTPLSAGEGRARAIV